MAFYKLGCIGGYDFEKISESAYHRFVNGTQVGTFINNTKCKRHCEEISLITHVELTPLMVRNIQLNCQHAQDCDMKHCKNLLRRLLENRVFENTLN